jgi:hypothetical protein
MGVLTSSPGSRAGEGGRTFLRVLLPVLAPVLLAGCADLEPWVKPYERDRLADPIMSLDRNPVSSSYMDHVREAREGARGAAGSSGGGCGCN